jgi:hypothetical protein
LKAVLLEAFEGGLNNGLGRTVIGCGHGDLYCSAVSGGEGLDKFSISN